jgi:outer membrane lipoprotein
MISRKNMLFLCAGLVILSSCSPVLNRNLMKEGERSVSFSALRQYPAENRDKLFIFGGVIVQTRLTGQGSQIEAIHVPVDRYGSFSERGRSEGRFLAIMPEDGGMLDPEVFRRGRRITIAGDFSGLKTAQIDDMEYRYPVFRIRQIHLWPREEYYYPSSYYDPWFYPYPYYFWGAWWSYPFYPYYPYYPGGPVVRPTPPPSQPPSQPPSAEPRSRLPMPAPQQAPPQQQPGPGRLPRR